VMLRLSACQRAVILLYLFAARQRSHDRGVISWTSENF
jgi:hypothetical protein